MLFFLEISTVECGHFIHKSSMLYNSLLSFASRYSNKFAQRITVNHCDWRCIWSQYNGSYYIINANDVYFDIFHIFFNVVSNVDALFFFLLSMDSIVITTVTVLCWCAGCVIFSFSVKLNKSTLSTPTFRVLKNFVETIIFM